MKYIIELPDTWDGTCETCPHTEHIGSEKDGDYEVVYNCEADNANCPMIKGVKVNEEEKENGDTITMRQSDLRYFQEHKAEFIKWREGKGSKK